MKLQFDITIQQIIIIKMKMQIKQIIYGLTLIKNVEK